MSKPVKTTDPFLSPLARGLADLRSSEAIEDFLGSFLNQSEIETFSKRLQIIWLLSQGRSYEEITDQLKVSSATISSISSRTSEPGIQKMIARLKLDRQLRSWLGLEQ